jgi:hypothetical protein
MIVRGAVETLVVKTLELAHDNPMGSVFDQYPKSIGSADPVPTQWYGTWYGFLRA